MIMKHHKSSSTKHETMSYVSISSINDTNSTDDAPVTAEREDEEALLNCAQSEQTRSKMTIEKPPIHKIPEDRVPSEKKVYFSIDNNCDKDTQDNIGAPPLWTTLTREIVKELWYQPEEIASMKAEAKYYILHRKESTPDEVCGLDRFTSQRALWKRSSIQYVLMSQRQNKGNEFVRRVSQRCSGWFREKAREQAFRDYCAVHDPLASLLDNENVENYNECFFSTAAYDACDRDDTPDADETNNENETRKRLAVELDGVEVSKRQRTI
jgi:hypothetical protein